MSPRSRLACRYMRLACELTRLKKFVSTARALYKLELQRAMERTGVYQLTQRAQAINDEYNGRHRAMDAIGDEMDQIRQQLRAM